MFAKSLHSNFRDIIELRKYFDFMLEKIKILRYIFNLDN